MLQEALKNKFAGRCNVFIPEDGRLSVIKGATLLGHHPDIIAK